DDAGRPARRGGAPDARIDRRAGRPPDAGRARRPDRRAERRAARVPGVLAVRQLANGRLAGRASGPAKRWHPRGMAAEGIGAAGSGGSFPGVGTSQPVIPGLRVPSNRVSRRAISYWTARAVLGAVSLLLVELGFAWAGRFSVAWQTALAVTAFVLVVHA